MKLPESTSRVSLLLCLVVAAVYANALWNGFAQDDYFYIVLNEEIHSAPWRLFTHTYWTSGVYRPVLMLSFALNYAISGLHPFGFHLLNLLLHAGVCVLLYVLLHNLLNRPRAAFAAALLFAVLPIHTEAVTAAVGRAELMATGFVFLAWLLHLRGREIAACCCFALAFLSKESAILFLALVPLSDFACRVARPKAYMKYALVFAIFPILRWKMAGTMGPTLIALIDNPLAHVPPVWRVLNALRVAWKYVALQIYPVQLSADYSYDAIPVSQSPVVLLPALLGWAAVLALWLWYFRRHAGVALAGSIYFTGFALTSNVLFPIGTILGERLAYLPSAGLCLLAGLGWEWLEARRKKLAVAMLAIVVAAYGVRTAVRNRDWRDDITLFTAALPVVPNSAKIHRNVGVHYMLTDRARARTEFDTAYRIYPEYPDLLAPMGLLYYQMGDKARAEQFMEIALGSSDRDNPVYDEMAVNYAALLLETGRSGKALVILNKIIADSPRYARAYSNRAVLYYLHHDFAAARADAETALRLDPKNTQAQTLLKKELK